MADKDPGRPKTTYAGPSLPVPGRRSAITNITSRVSRIAGGREMWALGDQALVSGTNFLTNVVLARLVGLEAFGSFALAWMAVLFANLFQNALIVVPMNSLRAKLEEDKRAAYLGVLLVHDVILCLFSAAAVQIACLVAAAYLHKPELLALSTGLAAATFCYLMQDFLRRYFFTTRRSAVAFWVDALSYIPQVPIIALVAHTRHLTTGGALWIIALTSAMGIAVSFFLLESAVYRWPDVRAIAVKHWGISRWLVLSVFFEWTSANLFFVAAPLIFGAAAAGVVRASQNIVGIAHIWFIGLENVIPAETARNLHEGGVDAAVAYMKQAMFKWGGFTAIFVAVVCVAPNTLLQLVYGAKYASYGYLLQLYGLLYFLVFFASPLRAILQALEYTAPVFWAYVVVSVFSLIFAAPFVHWFGLKGVVLGSIATQLLYQAVLVIMLKRRLSLIRDGRMLATGKPF